MILLLKEQKIKERSMTKKPTVLMILDGFGENPSREHNAVALADSPNIDRLNRRIQMNLPGKPSFSLKSQEINEF